MCGDAVWLIPARLPPASSLSLSTRRSDHASFESRHDAPQIAVAAVSPPFPNQQSPNSGSKFSRYFVHNMRPCVRGQYLGTLQPINRDPIKSSMLSEPFALAFLGAELDSRMFRSVDVASLFVDAKVLDSPMMRSITFAFAPARFTRSSKSATSASVLDVLNVGGSVRW